MKGFQSKIKTSTVLRHISCQLPGVLIGKMGIASQRSSKDHMCRGQNFVALAVIVTTCEGLYRFSLGIPYAHAPKNRVRRHLRLMVDTNDQYAFPEP